MDREVFELAVELGKLPSEIRAEMRRSPRDFRWYVIHKRAIAKAAPELAIRAAQG